MPNCSVFCCKKRSGTSSLEKDGVTFHIFPKHPELRNVWKRFCNNNRTWNPKRTSVICSIHFQTSDFQDLANNRRRLKENSIPSLIPNCICVSHSLPIEPTYNTAGAKSLATPNTLTSLGESSSQQIQWVVSIEKCAPKSTSQTETLSLGKSKMQKRIDHQKKKIKRLQAKNLYLRNKVAGLQELLRNSMKKKKMIFEMKKRN